MGTFAELYTYCQTLTPKISRRLITDRVFELTKQKVRAVKSSLDINNVRGFFVSAKNEKSRWVQQFGSNVIVLARDLNYCWERFVYTKELMHLFDEEDELTRTHDHFERLLTSFGPIVVNDPGEITKQSRAEDKAFFRTLSVLCPEKYRLDYQDQFTKKRLDHYAIALQLRIPELYVPFLISHSYPEILKHFNIMPHTGK